MDKIKILILGHNGKVGKRLCNFFYKNNKNIIVFNGDVNEKDKFYKFLLKHKDLTHIINLIGSFRGNKEEIFYKNVTAMNSVYSFVSEIFTNLKIIHFSSGGIYNSNIKLKKEKDKLNPKTYYTFCKYLGEEIASFNKGNNSLIVLRPGGIFGDGIDDGFIYNMDLSAKKDNLLRVIGSTNKIRSIVNIEYLLYFIDKIIKEDLFKNEFINIATETITLSSYISYLKAKYKKLNIVYVPDKSDNEKLSNMNLDNSLSRSILDTKKYKVF